MIQIKILQNKLLFLFFFFLFFELFSQNYSFDYMLVSDNKRISKTIERYEGHDVVNSKNHQWYMELGKNTITKNYYSILIDNDRNLISRFLVSDINRSPLYFEHEGTFKKTNFQYYKFKDLKIQNIGDLKYKISPQEILKPKKEIFEIEFQLEKFEDNLLIFNFELLSYHQQTEILNLVKEQLKSENQVGNFYIKEIKISYFKKTIFTSTIKPKKVIIDLSLQSNGN